MVLETATALAVAAVPEALPAVATIALAIGLRRMARRHALVRRLAAVESLGSTTIVCTDKTGTLTSGSMTVVRVWTPRADVDLRMRSTATPPADVLEAIRIGTLASWVPVTTRTDGGRAPDPVDQAIFDAATELGVESDAHSADAIEEVVPFSSHRKFMACFRNTSGRWAAYVKGAPGRVAAMSRLDEEQSRQVIETNDAMAAGGFRVLAVASGNVTGPTVDALAGLQFAGLIAMMDPPAPGVKHSIARLREAGLRTVMITGDQKRTAEAIGRELGLLGPDDIVLEESALQQLTPAELGVRLRQVGAFSRTTPEDKLAIVRALQHDGQVVAMFGDGVNDAPALKQADVGVAMGLRGTDVAREAAAIVLQDDRFETIVAAVEEGRVIYDNIRKFVFYLFSCNLAEIVVLLAASLAGLPAPLLPVQILWMYLVTDTFPALALALEPGDPDVMRRPPHHPGEALLSTAFVRQVCVYAAMLAAASLGAFVWALRYDAPAAQTVAFMTLSLSQVLHLGNARSRAAVLGMSQMLANRFALGAVALSVALQVSAGFGRWSGTTLQVVPLDAWEWTIVAVLSTAPAAAAQLLKVIRKT